MLLTPNVKFVALWARSGPNSWPPDWNAGYTRHYALAEPFSKANI